MECPLLSFETELFLTTFVPLILQLYNIFPWLVELLPGNHLKLINDVDELKDFSRGKVQEHKDSLDPDNPQDFIDCFLIRLKQVSKPFHYFLYFISGVIQ